MNKIVKIGLVITGISVASFVSGALVTKRWVVNMLNTELDRAMRKKGLRHE